MIFNSDSKKIHISKVDLDSIACLGLSQVARGMVTKTGGLFQVSPCLDLSIFILSVIFLSLFSQKERLEILFLSFHSFFKIYMAYIIPPFFTIF